MVTSVNNALLNYLTSSTQDGSQAGSSVLARAKAAAWKAGESGQRSGNVVRGRGIGYARYKTVATYTAVIAEVEVDRESGKIFAKRFTVAHDCGQIINPDGLEKCIEGNIVQGISRTLWEEVKFDNKNVTSVDWQSYPILDMKDAPEAIDITLMDRPDIAPSGVGEGTCRPLPAAIANAIFDATGVRLRQAPFTPARLKAALA